ncbi:hypothetical protein [Rhodopseudomonas sp. B29]|uniref:hypothetical protein n=1 Tax=Rhodopseudomonas sp. B29 TaxID=95607 RepID=UPI0003487FD5|nr:hypothetical protein [Rhodopseudomonas sp. B29]
MKTSISYAPMNSIVFVHGGPDEAPPWPVWGAQILATNSCISPVCFPEIDGPTEIVLGDADEVDPGRAPDLVSLLRVPDGDLRITTVGDEAAILRMPAPSLALVKIWRSHPRWPETVIIGIAPPNDLASMAPMLPTEEATRAAVDFPVGSDCLFLCNTSIADRPDVFDPWRSQRLLASGVVVPIAPASRLEVTDADPDLPRSPVFDGLLPTPNRLVGIFPTNRLVMLRADTPTTLTRVRAWVEPRPEGPTVILALFPADEP